MVDIPSIKEYSVSIGGYMSASKENSKEELLNMFFCSLEEDPSGQDMESLAEELVGEGLSMVMVMDAQAEASRLYSKNCF